MFPKAEKVSYRALLSILLSRFLINTLPTQYFLKDGSLYDHIILIGRPLIVSIALSAEITIKGFTTINAKFVLIYS